MRIIQKFLRRKTLSPEDTENAASSVVTRPSSRRTKSLSTRKSNNNNNNIDDENNNQQQQSSTAKSILRRQKGQLFAPWPRSTPLKQSTTQTDTNRQTMKPVTRSTVAAWSNTSSGGGGNENFVATPSKSSLPAPQKTSLLPDNGLIPGATVKIVGGTHKHKTGVLVKRAVVRGTVELDGPSINAGMQRKKVTVALHNLRHREASIHNQATAVKQIDIHLNENDASQPLVKASPVEKGVSADAEKNDLLIKAENADSLIHSISSAISPNEAVRNQMSLSVSSDDDGDSGPCQHQGSPPGLFVDPPPEEVENCLGSLSPANMSTTGQQQLDSPSRRLASPLLEDVPPSESQNQAATESSSPNEVGAAEATSCNIQFGVQNDNTTYESQQPKQSTHCSSSAESCSDDDGDDHDEDGGSTQGTLLLLSPAIPSSIDKQHTHDNTDHDAKNTKLSPATQASKRAPGDDSIDDAPFIFNRGAKNKSMGEEEGHKSDDSSTTLDPDTMVDTQMGEQDDFDPISPVSAQASQSFESATSSLDDTDYYSASNGSHDNSDDISSLDGGEHHSDDSLGDRSSHLTESLSPVVTRRTEVLIDRSNMDLEVNSSKQSLEDSDRNDTENEQTPTSKGSSHSLVASTRNQDYSPEEGSFLSNSKNNEENLKDEEITVAEKEEEHAEAVAPPPDPILQENPKLDNIPRSTRKKPRSRPCWGDWNEETDDGDEEESETSNDTIVDIIGGKHKHKTAVFVKRTPQCIAVLLEGKSKPVYLAPHNVRFRDRESEGCAHNIQNPTPPPTTDYNNLKWVAGARVTIIGGTHIHKTGKFVKKTPKRIAVQLDEARSNDSKPVYLKPIFVKLKKST